MWHLPIVQTDLSKKWQVKYNVCIALLWRKINWNKTIHRTAKGISITILTSAVIWLGTGKTLHMSQHEKSSLWIYCPEESFRVWIHGSIFSVPVLYSTWLKLTNKQTNKHTHTHIYIYIRETIYLSYNCAHNKYSLHEINTILSEPRPIS